MYKATVTPSGSINNYRDRPSQAQESWHSSPPGSYFFIFLASGTLSQLRRPGSEPALLEFRDSRFSLFDRDFSAGSHIQTFKWHLATLFQGYWEEFGGGLAASWSALVAPVAANSPESGICCNNVWTPGKSLWLRKDSVSVQAKIPPPPQLFFLVGGLHILYEGVKRERSAVLK